MNPGNKLLALLALLAAPGTASALTFTTLVTFDGPHGAQPAATLLLGMDGNLYGTTEAGGAYGLGTVFRLNTTSGELTDLYDFAGPNGANPLAPLIQDTNGALYGTTSAGGQFTNGTVFALAPYGLGGFTNQFTLPFDGTNGATPVGGLVQGADGNFYGTTSSGGQFNLGTLFALAANGLGGFTNAFALSFDGTNGAQPTGSLVLSQRGTNLLYGTTTAGGPYSSGTIFSFSPGRGSALVTLYAFTGGADGGGPQGGLTLAGQGGFFGTTSSGGTNEVGTIFEFQSSGGSTNRALTTLFAFDGTNGASPFAPPVQAYGTNFFGATFSGGAAGRGTIFSSAPSGSFTNLYSFRGGADGASPYLAGLTPGTNGNLYGVAFSGGNSGHGTLFEISGFAPLILASPQNQTVILGTNVTFTILAAGSAPLAYQWQRNSNSLTDGRGISGSATPTLTISNVTTLDAGTFSVLVRNTSGSVLSSGAILTVISPPTIHISSPANNALIQKTNVTITGTTADNVAVEFVYYQWNGGGWKLATPLAGWAQWTVPDLPVSKGTNTFQVYAVNGSGLSSTNDSISLRSSDFLPVSGLYTGLFFDTNNLAQESSGAFNLTVSAAGAFSGFLQTGNQRFPFKGQFATDGSASNLVQRGHSLSQLQLAMQLDLTNGTDQVTGTVAPTNKAWTAQLLGNRSVFNGKTAITTNAGQYTMLIPGFGSSVAQRAPAHARMSGAVSPTASRQTVRSFPAAQPQSLETAALSVTPGITTNAGQYTMLIPGSGSSVAQAAMPAVSPTASRQTVRPFPAAQPQGLATAALSVTPGLSQGYGTPQSLETISIVSSPPPAPKPDSSIRATTDPRFSLSSSGGEGRGEEADLIPRTPATPLLTSSQALSKTSPLPETHVRATTGQQFSLSTAEGEEAGVRGTGLAAPLSSDPTQIGDGWATLSVSTAGAIHLAGSLADGSKISQSAVVSKYGQFPIYIPLYSGEGSFLSWVTFASTGTNDLNGPMRWIKPAMANATFYPQGFSNEPTSFGSRYSPPLHDIPILLPTNLTLVLISAALPQPLTNHISLGPNNHVTSTNKVTLSFSTASGSFSGSVPNGHAKPFPISGVILTNLTQARGYFLSTNSSGQVVIDP